MNVQAWETVVPGVLRWRDACNVYALLGPDGAVIVDAGTGAWVPHVAQLPVRPVALLCTHFFRDHAAGAARAARELGLPILVPEREVELFRDAVEHHRGRQTWVVYANHWDHFAPVEDIPVAGLLRDHERLVLGGLEVEVLPLPGATVGQVGVEVRMPGSGRRVACVAETIHSPGRVPRVAPLQWDYSGCPGAVEVWSSAALLRRRAPDLLLPSLGEPIAEDIDGALAALQASMVRLVADEPSESGWIGEPEPAPQQVSDHVWTTRVASSASAFVVGRSGQAMAIDYGYHHWRLGMVPPAAHRRRIQLHTVDALRDVAGVERIDVAIPSHYHDDHVAGLPLLQRVHGTQVWAHRGFAELLADPSGSAFPCTEPTPIPVARLLDDDEDVTWDGIRFRFAGASGHTRFEQLIGWEVDGIRYAYTGDQYGFMARAAMEEHRAEWLEGDEVTDWSGLRATNNHVYRGGAFLDSYAASARWLRAWHPDIVLSGHWPVYRTDDRFFDLLDERTERYETAHRTAMPLGDADPHFEVSSSGGWLWPYRLHLRPGVAGSVRATVRNPFPHAADLALRLVVPDGWTGGTATIAAEARAEVSVTIELRAEGAARRVPIALELVADGRPFGQVAEALVTAGGERW